jgi:hypothetical protein
MGRVVGSILGAGVIGHIFGGHRNREQAPAPQAAPAAAPAPYQAPAALNQFNADVEAQRASARQENENLLGQLESSRRRNAIGARRARRGNFFEEGQAPQAQAPLARNLGG